MMTSRNERTTKETVPKASNCCVPLVSSNHGQPIMWCGPLSGLFRGQVLSLQVSEVNLKPSLSCDILRDWRQFLEPDDGGRCCIQAAYFQYPP